MSLAPPPTHSMRVARRPLQGWRVILNYLFVLPYLALFVVFSLKPLLSALQISLHDQGMFDVHPPFVGLKNYTDLWSDPLWLTVLGNTVEFVVITVGLTTLIALGTALLLRTLVHGQTLLRTIFFAPTVLSVGIVAIIWNWLYATDYGALNYLLSLVGINNVPWLSDTHLVIPSLSVATTWWSFGFPMVVFLAGLLNVPRVLYDAAAIDGANAWQRLLHITLPLLRPTLLFVLVTNIISQFQVFGQSFFTTLGGPGDASRTILMYLYETVWRHFQYGYGAAMAMTLALIMTLITAVNFLVLGRRQEGA